MERGEVMGLGDWSLSNIRSRNAQMLRNYMNEGGKVVFSGRNGWVQQVGTGTGLNSYSGYSWWQEPVYGFDYPPDQAGDDDIRRAEAQRCQNENALVGLRDFFADQVFAG